MIYVAAGAFVLLCAWNVVWFYRTMSRWNREDREWWAEHDRRMREQDERMTRLLNYDRLLNGPPDITIEVPRGQVRSCVRTIEGYSVAHD